MRACVRVCVRACTLWNCYRFFFLTGLVCYDTGWLYQLKKLNSNVRGLCNGQSMQGYVCVHAHKGVKWLVRESLLDQNALGWWFFGVTLSPLAATNQRSNTSLLRDHKLPFHFLIQEQRGDREWMTTPPRWTCGSKQGITGSTMSCKEEPKWRKRGVVGAT